MASAFDERAVASALINHIRAILPGVKGYPAPAASMATPCVIPTMEYELNAGFGATAGKITCDLLILVSPGAGDTGQKTLYQLISGTDAAGIPAAIAADETLGGAVQGVRVVGPLSRTYERFDGDGNLTYLGRFLRLTIYPL